MMGEYSPGTGQVQGGKSFISLFVSVMKSVKSYIKNDKNAQKPLKLESQNAKVQLLNQSASRAISTVKGDEKRMKRRSVLIFVLLTVFSLVLGACAPASTPTQAPTSVPVAAPTLTPANFPTGKFIKSGETDYGLMFNADGTFAVFQGEVTHVTGTYKVDGNTFTETSNNGGCSTNVDFTYAFDGTNLTFKYVGNPEDDVDCSGRNADFNNVTYVLADKISKTSTDANPVPEITIDAADYSYTAPETVTAGWVRVTLTNSGAEPHHVQFLQLNDGVTVQQFEDALKQAEGPALAMTKQVGGVGAVHPGGSAQAVINLPAGEYVILCLIPSPSDQMAHHTKGMIKSLTVANGDNQATEPVASLTVSLKDFMFEMPDSLPAGRIVIKVMNLGPEPHEFNILRLEDGKTVEDVKAFLSGAGGPPPFAPVGGMNGLDVGLSGYAELELAPGNYVAICNIPSPKGNGAPHFMLGMVQGFTVK
jgi:hypothetical protein